MKRQFLLLSLIGLAFSGCQKPEGETQKVLNYPVGAKIKGMDPLYASDKYSGNAVARIYEGLLEYHYLKRPFILRPNLAAAMPEVKENGMIYIFKLRPGVLFHDSECFKGGKGREMVAKDVVYSLKRTAAEPNALGWWVLDGKLVGLNEFRDQVFKGKATIDTPVEGIKALDKYTVQFKLANPFPQFLYAFAMPFFYVVPREAVEHYGKEFINYPVGTGPFILKKFNRTSRIVFHKNPTFRKKLYPSEGMPGDKERGLLVDGGKQLPLLDKLVIHINVESQPRWLSFQSGKLDLMDIPKDNFETAVTPSKELSPEMRRKGMRLDITQALDVTYTAFQHTNKLFSNVKLRRAMSLAYDPYSSNKLFFSSASLPAQSVIPPGIPGFIEGFKNKWVGPDIKRAKEMLVQAGFPGGKGLPEVTFDTSAATASRQIGEFFKKQMKLIGIKVKVITNPWPELLKKIQNSSDDAPLSCLGSRLPRCGEFFTASLWPQ